MSGLTANQWHVIAICVFPVVDCLGIGLSTVLSKTKNRLWLSCGVIFSAGVLLSAALVHMLPHASEVLNERWGPHEVAADVHLDEEYLNATVAPTADALDDHAHLRRQLLYYQQRELAYQRILQEHESHEEAFPWSYTFFGAAFLFLLCIEAVMERIIDVYFRGKMHNFFHDHSHCLNDRTAEEEVAAVLGEIQRNSQPKQQHGGPPKSIRCTHHDGHNHQHNHSHGHNHTHGHTHSHGNVDERREHDDEDPQIETIVDLADIHDHNHSHSREKNISSSTVESATIPHSDTCESCDAQPPQDNPTEEEPIINSTGTTFLDHVRKIHEQNRTAKDDDKNKADSCDYCDCDCEDMEPGKLPRVQRRPSFTGSAISAASTSLSKRAERRKKSNWAVTAPRPMVVQYHVGSSALDEIAAAAEELRSEAGGDARSLCSNMPAGDAIDELIAGLEKKEDQQTINPWVSILLTVVLSIHDFLEGLTLGSTEDTDTIKSIFIAVIVHKGFDSFILGSTFIAAGYGKPGNRHWFIILSCVFISMDVLGLGIGMAMGNGFGTDSLVPSILQCLVGGSFLFVSTIELIPGELEKMRAFSLPVFPILLSLCAGFSLMTLLGKWV